MQLKENKGAMKAHVPNAWPQTDNGESEYDAGHNCIAMERYALSAECEPMMLVSVAYLHRALLVGKSEPCSQQIFSTANIAPLLPKVKANTSSSRSVTASSDSSFEH